jgi:tRNA (guanine37-N1)-methyltransferase
VRDDTESTKLVLLDENVTSADLSARAKAFIAQHQLTVVPEHEVQLTYDHMTYEEVLRKILPTSDAPSSFEMVGHIAHLNLRDVHLPYKNVIGQVLIDKNPTIRTVVNKVASIGSQFREFKMEVLAGDDDFMVTSYVEQQCTFMFDYSKVYFNARLQMEHSRLVNSFAEESVIVDMFAGIGPFAVPAAKLNGCKVYANDLNPHSYEYLVKNALKNKVQKLVHAFNMDARDFMRKMVQDRIVADEVVMNLPASAVQFLDVFRGLYPPGFRLPRVHCYTFAKGEDPSQIALDDVQRLIGMTLPQGSVSTHDVRDVAPNKHMICVSFALPAEYAYSVSEGERKEEDDKSNELEPDAKKARLE